MVSQHGDARRPVCHSRCIASPSRRSPSPGTVTDEQDLLSILATLLSGGSFWIAERAVDDLPGRVDVDGRLLRMRIEGQGSPTVVLEIGLGGPLEEWDMVQPEVARFTKVVAYDRIGAVETQSIAHRRGCRPRTARRVGESRRRTAVRARRPVAWAACTTASSPACIRTRSSAWCCSIRLRKSFSIGWRSITRNASYRKRIVKNWAEGAGIWDTMDQVKAAAPLPDVPIVVVTGTKFIDDPLLIERLPVWTACTCELGQLTTERSARPGAQ